MSNEQIMINGRLFDKNLFARYTVLNNLINEPSEPECSIFININEYTKDEIVDILLLCLDFDIYARRCQFMHMDILLCRELMLCYGQCSNISRLLFGNIERYYSDEIISKMVNIYDYLGNEDSLFVLLVFAAYYKKDISNIKPFLMDYIADNSMIKNNDKFAIKLGEFMIAENATGNNTISEMLVSNLIQHIKTQDNDSWFSKVKQLCGRK